MLNKLKSLFYSSPLNRYRAMADIHYQTFEYTAKVEAIRSVIDGIRGCMIALDIDGTIISDPVRGYLVERNIRDEDRLRRAFAQEILDIINDSNNGGMLWTGQSRKDTLEKFKRAGVHNPDKIHLVTREEYAPVLFGREMNRRVQKIHQLPESPRRASLLEKIKIGSCKIPSLMGADVLIDDHADLDEDVCLAAFGESETQKLIKVPTFDFSDPDQLQSHYRNMGLFHAIQEMGKRLS